MARQRVLITGGTGLIGRRLALILAAEGYEVALLSRAEAKAGPFSTYRWDIEKQYAEEEAFSDLYGIVHLAGAPIADKRWTARQKRVIVESRVKSVQLLAQCLEKQTQKPSVFIGASAIGYYGADTGDELLTEEAPAGSDFLADVVKKWEQAYEPIAEMGIRMALIRAGVVLSPDGGALPKLVRPVRWGVGAALGSGRQWMSWIHIQDVCRMFVWLLKQEQLAGVFNGVSPEPVTNSEFTGRAAGVLRRPLWLPRVPGFVLKAALGEMAGMVLGGNRVSAEKLQKAGFTFRFPTINEALQDLLGGDSQQALSSGQKIK